MDDRLADRIAFLHLLVKRKLYLLRAKVTA